MIIKNDYLVLEDFENTRIDKWIKLKLTNFSIIYRKNFKKKITVNKKSTRIL